MHLHALLVHALEPERQVDVLRIGGDRATELLHRRHIGLGMPVSVAVDDGVFARLRLRVHRGWRQVDRGSRGCA